MEIKEEQHAAAFAALYNCSCSHQIGGLMKMRPMTVGEAQEILDLNKARPRGLYFDYFRGTVMKMKICNTLDFRLFDRDNGQGAGERAVRATLGMEAA